MSTVPIDKFQQAIDKALKEYAGSVKEHLDDITRVFAKKGAQAVKQAARGTFGGTGKYAAGWTSQIETGRVSVQGQIFNEKVPGLPHLLENGHAKRGGGRVPGRVHIAPVEEKIATEFQKAVEEKL